jgi:hypothetical protein
MTYDLAGLVGRAWLFLTPAGRRTRLAPSASMVDQVLAARD